MRVASAFGAHVAVADVDTETGKVVLRRVVTVDDAGTVINPLLAEGQRHGGIAQGAAQAFLEEVIYDADGNPLTASFADYPFLSATEVPSFELADMATQTSYNPLGAKGIGRPGTIGATPAVQNAVVDALAHLGIRHIDMPASPQRVWQALRSVPGAAVFSRTGAGSSESRDASMQVQLTVNGRPGPTTWSHGSFSCTSCGSGAGCAPQMSAVTQRPAARAPCC